MKRFLIFLFLSAITGNCFSQSKIDSAYSLFKTIDWTEWHNIDTSGCKTIEQKYVSRQKYASYFNKLLCQGVSKDTVEKYLGVGGEFPYAGDHQRGWKTKSTKPKYAGSYCLLFDCRTKEWVSVIRIMYKNGKVVKYTQGAIYY